MKFVFIVFNFLSLFDWSLKWDTERLKLFLYLLNIMGFEILMRSPKILGIVFRLSVLLLQLIDETEDLCFLFHTPPQVAFIQDLNFSLLLNNGVFDLLYEEYLFQNVLEDFKFDRFVYSDWLLAEYFSLILLCYRYFEILAEFNKVTLDDLLMILLHFVKCLTL